MIACSFTVPPSPVLSNCTHIGKKGEIGGKSTKPPNPKKICSFASLKQALLSTCQGGVTLQFSSTELKSKLCSLNTFLRKNASNFVSILL